MNTANTMNANIDKAYSEVEKILHSLAWDTAKRYGIPFEECQSECSMAFVKAYNWRHDPTKGTKFSTTCYNIAKWRLRNLVIGRVEADPVLEVNEELLEGETTPPPFYAADLVAGLGGDVKLMLDLLLDIPRDLLGVTATPRQHLRNIKKHMVKLGHAEEAVEHAASLLRARVTEALA